MCFLWKKTFDQGFGANLKKNIFLQNFAQIFLFFLPFLASSHKRHISTSILSVQHPNAGRNTQHLGKKYFQSTLPFGSEVFRPSTQSMVRQSTDTPTGCHLYLEIHMS